MKLLGALTVFLACGYAGYLTSYTLARRTAALRSFADGLILLESEIGQRQTPLLQAFDLCARQIPGEAGKFFAVLSGRMEQDQTIRLPELFRQVMLEQDWGLTRQDAAILLALAPALGRYDSQTQARVLKQRRRQLEQSMEAAREEQTVRGRIWRTAGLCGGAALALLVL